MQISDYILLISATIVVLGWFTNDLLNRRLQISLRRTDYRMSTLKNYISFYIEANDKRSLDGFNDIQVSFHLYGYDDEIELVKKIADLVTTQRDDGEWLKLMRDLNVISRNRLRAELGLQKVEK